MPPWGVHEHLLQMLASLHARVCSKPCSYAHTIKYHSTQGEKKSHWYLLCIRLNDLFRSVLLLLIVLLMEREREV